MTFNTHPECFDELTQVLKTIADPARLTILEILSLGEQNVTSIHRRANLSQPTVSRHLAQMRIQRLVVARRDGKQVLYSLGPQFHNDSGALTLDLPGASLSLRLPAEQPQKVVAA